MEKWNLFLIKQIYIIITVGFKNKNVAK
jgi:hypothetical protein